MTKNSERAPRKPLSHQAALEANWARLAMTVMGFLSGTLWWVKEELWKEKLKGYDQRSTRDAHPGLSIRRIPIADIYSQIPMLHGHSHGQGVAVRGINSRTPDRITKFGGLLAPIQVLESLPIRGGRRIQPNIDKPRLNEPEMKALDRFLNKWKL